MRGLEQKGTPIWTRSAARRRDERSADGPNRLSVLDTTMTASGPARSNVFKGRASSLLTTGRLSSEAGYNLVEVMVVLVIAGILLATAVPSMQERNARSRTEGAARELSARMQVARQLAVSKRLPYRMTFDVDDRSYYFERQENDSTWTMDPDETYSIEGVEEIGTDIGGRVGESLVHFETRGTIEDADSPALVTIVSAHGDTAVLSVVRTGRATVLMSH